MGRKSESGYLYIGCRASSDEASRIWDEVGGARLAHVVPEPHVTLDFLPRVAYEESFGSAVVWDAVGYANDGRNEGLLVEPAWAESRLWPALRLRARHHMTLSLAEGAAAKDTAKLSFAPLEPFRITSTYGASTYDGSWCENEIGSL